jgi:hypothetical protein
VLLSLALTLACGKPRLPPTEGIVVSVIGEWLLKATATPLTVDSHVKPGAEVKHVVQRTVAAFGPQQHSWRDDLLVVRFSGGESAKILCSEDKACNATDVFLIDWPGASIDVAPLRRKAHEGLSEAEVLNQPIVLLSRNSGNTLREAVLTLNADTIPVAPMLRETGTAGIFLLVCPSGPKLQATCPNPVTRRALCPATGPACRIPGSRPGIYWVWLYREAGEEFLALDQDPALILVMRQSSASEPVKQQQLFNEEAARIALDFPDEEAAARSLLQGLIVALSKE